MQSHAAAAGARRRNRLVAGRSGAQAGAKAAETLRAEGFAGRVLLIGPETERPYERPPLSKGLLLGTADRDEPYVHSRSWYDEQNVELRTGVTVRSFDPAAHTVRTEAGEEINVSTGTIQLMSPPAPQGTD